MNKIVKYVSRSETRMPKITSFRSEGDVVAEELSKLHRHVGQLLPLPIPRILLTLVALVATLVHFGRHLPWTDVYLQNIRSYNMMLSQLLPCVAYV